MTSPRLKKITVFLILIAIVFTNSMPITAHYKVKKKEILFFVPNNEYKALKKHPLAKKMKILPVALIDRRSYVNYDAVAMPYRTKLKSDDFNRFFKNGVRIYFYGKLSLVDFQKKLNVAKIQEVNITGLGDKKIQKNARVRIYNKKGKQRKFNIIGMNDSVLRTFMCDIDCPKKYLALYSIKAVYEDFKDVRLNCRTEEYNMNPYYVQYFDKFKSKITVTNEIKRNYTDDVDSYKNYNFVLDSKVNVKSKKPISAVKCLQKLLGDTEFEATSPKPFTMMPFSQKVLTYNPKMKTNNIIKIKKPVQLTSKVSHNKKKVVWKVKPISYIFSKNHEFEIIFENKITTDDKQLNVYTDLKLDIITGANNQYRQKSMPGSGIIYSYFF